MRGGWSDAQHVHLLNDGERLEVDVILFHKLPCFFHSHTCAEGYLHVCGTVQQWSHMGAIRLQFLVTVPALHGSQILLTLGLFLPHLKYIQSNVVSKYLG